jgi:dipeptidyl aminopeptidase/acylaminoacyl peptidase
MRISLAFLLTALYALGVAADPAGLAALPAKPARVPVENFAKLPFIDTPVLSPSGDRIAARIDVNGTTMLAILYPLEKGRQPTLIPAGKLDLLWYRWANNDRLLVSVAYSIDKGAFQGIYAIRLEVYDLVKGEIRTVGPKMADWNADEVIYTADDGSYLLLAAVERHASYPSVYRADLATGDVAKVLVSKPPITSWHTDANGVIRLGLGYRSGKVDVLYRERKDEEFTIVAKAEFANGESDFDSFEFGSTSGSGYVLSNARTGRFGLYEFDWKAFKLGKPLFEQDTADLDNVQMSEDGRTVEAVWYTDDRRRVVWFDPTMKELQAEIDKLLPDRINWIASTSKGRTKAVVWSGTANDPGRYYYLARDLGVMEGLAIPYEALAGVQLAPVKAVSFRSRDGLDIPAYLTLPVGRAPTRLPLIVMPHGGPFARDTWRYDPWVQFLANRGYAVLQPNFRGSTGYGKDFLAKGFGQWGTGMQDDLVDGLQWLVRDGTVDPARVCIMGASFGGYSALMGAIRNPQPYRCAISFAGVTDLDDILSYDANRLLPARYWRFRDQVEGDNKADLGDISPVNHAADVSIPVLLIHGTQDYTVPYRQARSMVKALTKAKKPFEYIELKGVGHGFDNDADHTRFLAAVDAFLAKNNPAD